MLQPILSPSLHLIVTPQSFGGEGACKPPAVERAEVPLTPLAFLWAWYSRWQMSLLLSENFLFCCSHFHFLSTLFSMITHTSAPAFSSFSSDFPVWLPLSNLFAHCHLVISCRVSPSCSTPSSCSTDFYLHFLLLFIFPLPWTLSCVIP